MAGGNAAAMQAHAAKLKAASAPVLSAIAKARPLINAATLTSHGADRWSGEWQSLAKAVTTYLSDTLPGDVHSAITAAQKKEKSKTPAHSGAHHS